MLAADMIDAYREAQARAAPSACFRQQRPAA